MPTEKWGEPRPMSPQRRARLQRTLVWLAAPVFFFVIAWSMTWR